MNNRPMSHIIAGAILAIVAIVLFFTYYYLGLSYESNYLTYIPPVITLLLLVFFVISYGRAMNHNVTFGSLFGYGFKATMIFALIMSAFMIGVNYLLPAYKEKFIEHFTSEMDKAGNVPDEQRQIAVSATSKYFILLMVGGSLFLNMITGTIASLVGAVFARKEPATPFDANPVN